MANEKIVIVRHDFSEYERYQIAFHNDVVQGNATRETWNAKPRLATRDELVAYVERAMSNEGLAVGDEVPNLKPDGRVEAMDGNDE